MYSVNELLKKLNGSKAKFGKGETLTATGLTSLAELMVTSPGERKALFKEKLTWGEAEYLQQAIEKEKKANKVIESRLLARANPQLSRAVHLGIRALPETQDYNDMFGGRADRYVKAGSVASMFSPAGYLTELYREGRKLLRGTSIYALDNRRPDLASLALTQENMDEELSTLTLSNEILKNLCEQKEPNLLPTLAGHRIGGELPYHGPYNTVSQAIVLQDETLSALADAPDVMSKASSPYLAAIKSNISPELYQLLVEEIPDDASDKLLTELWTKNFGNRKPEFMNSTAMLCDYYNISDAALNTLSGMAVRNNTTGSKYSGNLTTGGVLVYSRQTESGGYVTKILQRDPAGHLMSYYNYVDVIPKNNEGEYSLVFSGKYWDIDDVTYELSIDNNKVVNKFPSSLHINKHYEIPFNVTTDTFITKKRIFLQVRFLSEVDGFTHVFDYIEKTLDPRLFLLRLNKIILLYKATSLEPEVIRQLTQSQPGYLTVNKETLSTLFYVTQAMRAYGIDSQQALVLTHAGINQFSPAGQVPLFDRLFNTPPLNGQMFTPDNTILDLTPGSNVGDSVSRNALKRGLQVNDNELLMLWQMASKTAATEFTCSIENISALYLIRLIARVHGLSVAELAVLKSLSSYRSVALETLTTPDQIGTLIATVRIICDKLKKQSMTVDQLYIMTTDVYSIELTPDIENFLTTLRNGLHYTEAGTVVVSEAVPLIAAALQLNGNEIAASLLRWLDFIRPAGLTGEKFLTMALKDEPKPSEITQLITVCQVLSQLTITVQTLALSEAELKLVTTRPELLSAELDSLPHDVDTIQQLIGLHAFINRCGQRAAEIMTALENARLSTSKLADVLGHDKSAVDQALALVSPQAKMVADYQTIDKMLQWLNVASTLHVTPATIDAMLALDYTQQTGDTATTYPAWEKISLLMAAGLTSSQSLALQNIQDETFSDALCSFYLANVNKTPASDRDGLYSYLLIDNQVSAQVRTTRLAEAIASIQLYINRILSGAESKDLLVGSNTGQFFADWDTYNKRYSTWSGVSRLVYYPENYIDPSVRIGQTKMMGTLLQSISQSSINKDTVEDAFKSYLTEFEQVANLDVMSGYHDNTSLNTGLTYFIGRNQAQQTEYYWRSADHSKMHNGEMSANAWTEWNKIVLGISPCKSIIQPVVFNDRLYVCWLERTEVGNNNGASSNSTFSYSLNLSHIRYDNSWSSPFSFDVTDAMGKAMDSSKKEDDAGLFVSCDKLKQELIIIFYQKKSDYNAITKPGKDMSFVCLSADMSIRIPEGDAELDNLLAYSKKQYDILSTSSDKKTLTVKNTYAVKYSAPKTVGSSTAVVEHDDITFNSTSLTDIALAKILDDGVEVEFTAGFTLVLTENFSLDEKMAAAIKDMYSKGDKIYTLKIDKPATTPYGLIVVINASINKIGFIAYNKTTERLSEKIFMWYFEVTSSSNGDNVYFLDNIFGDTVANSVHIFDISSEDVNKLIDGALKNFKVAFFDGSADLDFSDVHIEGMKFNSIKNVTFTSATIELGKSIKNISLSINNDVYSYSQWSGNSGSPTIRPGSNKFISTKRNVTLKDANFIKNLANIDVTIEAKDADNKTLASRRMTIPVEELSEGETKTITLNTNSRKAQYMTVNDSHVRLNTLFARNLVEKANIGIDTILTMATQNLQEPGLSDATPVPMDFSGANALYFWELFYYTPVLIAKRFLQEQRYTEANRWLKYVFSPSGYIIEGEYKERRWNVRPLDEDIAWNDDPMDSVDPDAVAQNDPMHYKVATFMQALDQLLARGDSAYRLLERDGLNEAKMWYTQALDMLGDQPIVNIGSAWTSPRLDEAASETTALYHERDLLALRMGIHIEPEPAEVYPQTANSLVGLFLPEMNDRLQGYWDTLAQRMYNLRHNLSIDGQPLSLAIYANPANPAALLSAAATISSGGEALPAAIMPLYRFPVMLESARSLVGQLSQFGATLQAITERQDAEALEKLLQVQGSELMLMTLTQQEQVLAEIDADKRVLQETRHGVQQRFDSYKKLYEEDVNAGEKKAMDLYLESSTLTSIAMGSYTIAGGLDVAPNIYGMAFGGSRYGAIARAVGTVTEAIAQSTRVAADKTSQSEVYRRRRQEWEIQQNQAESDLKQIDAQLAAVTIRRAAAVLQKTQLETQQGQLEAQLAFLQTKFTSQALYNWLRGKLAAIYYQFYDLTVSRCLMAQEAYRWERSDEAASFVKPGAWQGTYAGLLAGETRKPDVKFPGCNV